MTNLSYAEKLKDPRWQKCRLRVMDRDKFTCQICFRKDKTLNVHHKKPDYNKDPWDFEDKELITLCQDCHGIYHREEKIMGLVYRLINAVYE